MIHGPNYECASEWMAGAAAEKGDLLLGATEDLLMDGVGSYRLKIAEDLPEVDATIVPSALKLRKMLAGKNVVLVMTGGNLSIERLKAFLARPASAAAVPA